MGGTEGVLWAVKKILPLPRTDPDKILDAFVSDPNILIFVFFSLNYSFTSPPPSF